MELLDQKFNEIFTNEGFRNDVAFAHSRRLSDGSECRETCTYPIRYIVTDKQIEIAQNELQRAKKELYENHFNDLIFVCMGMEYSPKYDDDVCNHRIRTEFINSKGHIYFIELGTGSGDRLRIDHSVDRDLQDINESKFWEYNRKWIESREQGKFGERWKKLRDKYEKQIYFNYRNLERDTPDLKYTKTNVLNLVNEYFCCNFENIIISQHTARLEDKSPICKSL